MSMSEAAMIRAEMLELVEHMRALLQEGPAEEPEKEEVAGNLPDAGFYIRTLKDEEAIANKINEQHAAWEKSLHEEQDKTTDQLAWEKALREQLGEVVLVPKRPKIFLGMMRVPWNEFLASCEDVFVVRCHCGSLLSSQVAIREHWQVGHFDTEVYSE